MFPLGGDRPRSDSTSWTEWSFGALAECAGGLREAGVAFQSVVRWSVAPKMVSTSSSESMGIVFPLGGLGGGAGDAGAGGFSILTGSCACCKCWFSGTRSSVWLGIRHRGGIYRKINVGSLW